MSDSVKDKSDLTDIEGQGEVEGGRLVPVSESIRYRKRAQAAEKSVDELSRELAEVEGHVHQIQDELKSVKVERDLVSRLSAEGAVDVETAVLVIRGKLGASESEDVDGCIEELKREKGFLFSDAKSVDTGRRGTRISKSGIDNNGTVLANAAKRAAVTGNRFDLQEYLRLRRKFV